VPNGKPGLPVAPGVRVVLVGFEDQENLGLRYLAARLKQAGHGVRLVSFEGGAERVLAAIRELQPQVVGFSLIFQYMADTFARLMEKLRGAGVAAHFTIGGHYCAFEFARLLDAVPALDSVVRFEGEDTLLQLAEAVAGGSPWWEVAGIAYRGDQGATLSEPRPGRGDLDTLPWPDRDDVPYEEQKLPMASVLGSRGCPRRCAFCSIAAFYEGNGTARVRRRDVRRIADELSYLHHERGVRLILWQDDDFLGGGRAGVDWACSLAREIVRRGLHRHLRWKISCRSDEVSADVLALLTEAGLSHVYLGVESGDADDLAEMDKHLEPDSHFRAKEILVDLGLSFDFGFMLLNPWSDLKRVLNNLEFLQAFAGDGAAPAGFCRMLPYAGTAIERRLDAEGRLKRNGFDLDYDFADVRIESFCRWMLQTFSDRHYSPNGTLTLLRILVLQSHLDFPDAPADPVLREAVHALTAVSNQAAVNAAAEAAAQIESGSAGTARDAVLCMLRDHHEAQDRLVRQDLAALLSRRPEVLARMAFALDRTEEVSVRPASAAPGA
jgi:anaerobic magnesium-protoporphyrin IX monomethyl ester cyclase